MDGCPLEDLCLTRELPGYPGYPLLPSHPGGGADVRRRCAALRCAALVDRSFLFTHLPPRLNWLTASPSPPPCSALQVAVSTPAELRRYLDAVVDATLGGGVAAQVAAFRSGFDALFPLDCLGAFYEDEIEVMLCGE